MNVYIADIIETTLNISFILYLFYLYTLTLSKGIRRIWTKGAENELFYIYIYIWIYEFWQKSSKFDILWVVLIHYCVVLSHPSMFLQSPKGLELLVWNLTAQSWFYHSKSWICKLIQTFKISKFLKLFSFLRYTDTRFLVTSMVDEAG